MSSEVNSYKNEQMQYNKKNIDNLFYIFITTHLILWLLVPSLTNNNLPLDTIEHLAWGSNLDWGFNKHPPAVAFFVEIFYQIFGAKDWAFYLLSQIFVIIAFIFVFKLSKELFKNKTSSLLSVLLLEGIYFYNYTTPEFNVYITELPFWTLAVYFAYKSNTENDFKYWFFLGFFAAIGFLSHYLFSYLLLSILIFYIYVFYKDKKFNFRCLISLEIFIIMIIPHLIWLVENNYITITYGLHRTGSVSPEKDIIDHLINPLYFLMKQFGILIPFWIMLFSLIKKFRIKINFKDRKLLFLIFINFLPLILITLTSLLTGAKIKTMWMTPFYLFIGVLFIYIFQTQINLKRLNSFISVFLILFIFSPFVYTYVSITKTDKRTDYQGKEIAQNVEDMWNKENDKPINVVLGDEWFAGNLSYHLRSRPIWEGPITQKKLNSLSKYKCIDKVCVGNR